MTTSSIHYELSDYVSQTVNKTLNKKLIYSVSDLLAYEGIDEKICHTTINKLQLQIRDKLSIPLQLINHSWYKLYSYININTENTYKTFKGTIGKLVISDHMIFLLITYNKKQYLRTPSNVILTNELWRNCDIISDSENDNDSHKSLIPNKNTNKEVVNDAQIDTALNILPSLKITKYTSELNQLSQTMRKCLKSTFTEVNNMIELMNYLTI